MLRVNRIILTKEIGEKLLKSQLLGHTVADISTDLGKTTQEVLIVKESFTIGGVKVPLKAFLGLKEGTIYVFEDKKFKSIDFFSDETNLFYKLVPTKNWPTVMLSSVPMHRFKTVSPKTSAFLMIEEVSPLRGKVLDTCCGLGYTAILAAQNPKVETVRTFEVDENVLRIAEYNPYSEELFSNKKIQIKKGNVFEEVKNLENNYFDRIVHDPPTISFGTELYSETFYKGLFRVAKSGAVLYHYCPNPGKTKGKEFYPSIEKWLIAAGFKQVAYHEKSSGIRGIKP